MIFSSSRRRHTRFDCDWSSDVCSSDLSTIDAAVWPGDKSTLRGTVQRFASEEDRKSTRLNSSHSQISYAVFCLKKKKNTNLEHRFLNPARYDQRLFKTSFVLPCRRLSV